MRATEGKSRGWWFALMLSFVHTLATLIGLFILFYTGQQAADLSGQLPPWTDVAGAAVLVLSLPIVYPLLSLELLRPQGLGGLFALSIACVANSVIVVVAVRWIVGRIESRKLLHRQ